MSNQDLLSDQSAETPVIETTKLGTFQRLRKAVSDYLSLAAIASLGFFVLITGYMWLYAWQQGRYPRVPWPESVTYGPWESDITLNYLWREALNGPVLAFLAALLSCIVRPNGRAGIALGLSMFFALVWFMHISLLGD